MSWLDSFFGNTFTISFGGVALTQRQVLDFEGAGISVADDPTNKRTVATVPGGGVSAGAETTISFTVNHATTSSASPIPANALIAGLKVLVTTPFNAGTLAIGRTGSTSLLLPPTGTGPTGTAAIDVVNCAAGTLYDLSDTTLAAWGASALAALATVAGASSGSLTVTVTYSVPLS